MADVMLEDELIPQSADVETSFVKSEMQTRVEEELLSIRSSYLEPYDTVFHFLTPFQFTTPMVMMLGNHSSGKSTLINYLSGREIQQTGVAPTDDGFTVIKRGTFDMDADGPTVVSNPKLQFTSLHQYGLSFVTHFKMKNRRMPASSRIPMDMVLVDTPGMIDTPIHVVDRTSEAGQLRGYDFLAVTRWFAQQSDVILLMFDPANPGTTGETLDVLTKSLSGYEHKFLLVMNKVDMFEKATDFARAYGTLCWNLSKVIKLKDIPRVYTTFTPHTAALGGSETSDRLPTNTASKSSTAVEGQQGSRRQPGTVPEEELVGQRHEILNEILSAPMRRMDNLITETDESARNLLLAARVSKMLKREYRQRELIVYSGIATACLTGPAMAVALSSVSITATALITLLSIAAGCGAIVLSRLYLNKVEQALLDSMDSQFSRLYPGKSRTKDAELRWQHAVKPEIMRVVLSNRDRGGSGIAALPSYSSRVCRGIESVIKDNLPMLRSKVSDYKHDYFKQKNAGGSNESV